MYHRSISFKRHNGTYSYLATGGKQRRYNNIIFTIHPTTVQDVCAKVGEPSENIDIIEPYTDIIYWSFDLKNYRKSSWWIKTASTDRNTKITIRTVNTMKKLFNLVNSND